jgi:hypothetical protein
VHVGASAPVGEYVERVAPLEAEEIYFGINRVEPRELNSRPVFGRVFVFNPKENCVLLIVLRGEKLEVAMTIGDTITRQRPGGSLA